jgi:hypothetical protein
VESSPVSASGWVPGLSTCMCIHNFCIDNGVEQISTTQNLSKSRTLDDLERRENALEAKEETEEKKVGRMSLRDGTKKRWVLRLPVVQVWRTRSDLDRRAGWSSFEKILRALDLRVTEYGISNKEWTWSLNNVEKEIE